MSNFFKRYYYQYFCLVLVSLLRNLELLYLNNGICYLSQTVTLFVTETYEIICHRIFYLSQETFHHKKTFLGCSKSG